MQKQSGSEVTRYFGNIAAYQPSHGQARRTVSLVLLLLIVFLIALATRANAGDVPANYLVLKGGLYSPGTSHDLDTRMDGFVTTADIGFRF